MKESLTKKSLIGEYHELKASESKAVGTLLKKIKKYLEDHTDDDLVFISQHLELTLAEDDFLG